MATSPALDFEDLLKLFSARNLETLPISPGSLSEETYWNKEASEY